MMPAEKAKAHIIRAAYTLLILFLVWVLFPRSFNAGGGGFWMCLDYIREGSIYGGQPYCAQGPVIYYLGYVIDGVLGPLSASLTLPAISLLSHVVIFITLRTILKRHRLHNPLIYPLLYVLLVFRYFGEVASSLATALFVVGFYLTNESDDRARNLFAIIPFTMAVFTKYTVVFPIALVMTYSIVKDWLIIRRSDEGMSASFAVSYQRVGLLALLVISVFGTFLCLIHIFPNIAAYTIYAHTNQVKGSLVDGFELVIQYRMLSSFSAIILFASVAWSAARGYFDRETFVYPLLQVTLAVNGLLFIMACGDPKLGDYYLLPLAPFLLASMMVVRKRSNKVFAFLVLGVLVHPSIFPAPLSGPIRFWSHDGSLAARREVEYGLRLIPPQSGFVLMEGLPGGKEYMQDMWPQLDQSRIDMIPAGEKGYSQGEGPDWARELRLLTTINPNESQAHIRLTPQEEAVRADILAGKYSLIVIGPPSWFSLKEIFNSAEGYLKSYCMTYVPNFEYRGDGKTFTVLLFKYPNQCEDFRKSMITHYRDNFTGICDLGQKAQAVVKKVIGYDNAEIPFICNVEYDYKYSDAPAYQAHAEDLLLFLLLLPMAYVLLASAEG